MYNFTNDHILQKVHHLAIQDWGNNLFAHIGLLIQGLGVLSLLTL